MRVRLRHRRLTRALARSRLSQNRWAQKMGLTSGHLSQLVNGRRPYPSPQTRTRLLEALDVPFEELFTIEEDSPARERPAAVGFNANRPLSDAPRLHPRSPLSGENMLSSLLFDVRFSLRLLRKHLALTAVATTALALGIGANTAIFSVLEATVFRTPPYPDADRVLSFWQDGSWSRAEFEALGTASRSFQVLAAVAGSERTLTHNGDPALLEGIEATSDLFSVLGVRPRLGRGLRAEDSLPGARPVVVLSDGLWRRLGSDPGIVGSTIRFDQVDHEVVGVAPAGFYFPTPGVEYWAPLEMDPASRSYRGAFYLDIVGRLAAGSSRAQAEAEIPALARVMRERFQYPQDFDKFAGSVGYQSLQDRLTGPVRPSLLLMVGVVGVVLLMACANVANLILAHVLSRHQEIALRTALGSSRVRIVRQVLLESLIIGVLGGGVGLLVAVGGVELLAARLPAEFSNFPQIGVNWVVLAFAFGLSLAAGLTAGVVPALRATRGDVKSSLSMMRHGGDRFSNRTGDALVVAEVALAVILVLGAGLMLKSVWNLGQVDLGFQPDGLTTFAVLPAAATYDTGERRTALYSGLIEGLEAINGVSRAAGVHVLPIGGSGWNTPIVIEGRTEKFGDLPGSLLYRRIVGRYFDAMAIPLLRGRRFEPSDDASGEPVCIINQQAARQYWPDKEPLGRRIRTGPDGSDWLRIVGVVGDVRSSGVAADSRPAVYRPYAQSGGSPGFSMVLRSRLPSDVLMREARQTIRQIDPHLPIYADSSMQAVIDRSLGGRRLLMSLLTAFGVVALCLGSVGIYGVISYRVSRSLHEMGVRLALGAQVHHVVGLVLGRGIALSLAGLALGIVASLGAGRLLEGFLFGVSRTDPAIFAAAAAVVLAVATLASYLPARRAASRGQTPVKILTGV